MNHAHPRYDWPGSFRQQPDGYSHPGVWRALSGEATFVEDFPLDTMRQGHRERAYFTFCHSPVCNETGAIVGVLDTIVETTDKVDTANQLRGFATNLAEQVRERTEDRDRMWQLSCDLMMIGDLRGIIVAVNPAWTQTLGWSDSELLGRSYIDFLHHDDVDAARFRVVANAPSDGAVSIVNRYRCKDGTYRWISWRSVVGENRITAVGRDITEEKQRAEALQEAEDHLRRSQKMEVVGLRGRRRNPSVVDPDRPASTEERAESSHALTASLDINSSSKVAYEEVTKFRSKAGFGRSTR